MRSTVGGLNSFDGQIRWVAKTHHLNN